MVRQSMKNILLRREVCQPCGSRDTHPDSSRDQLRSAMHRKRIQNLLKGLQGVGISERQITWSGHLSSKEKPSYTTRFPLTCQLCGLEDVRWDGPLETCAHHVQVTFQRTMNGWRERRWVQVQVQVQVRCCPAWYQRQIGSHWKHTQVREGPNECRNGASNICTTKNKNWNMVPGRQQRWWVGPKCQFEQQTMHHFILACVEPHRRTYMSQMSDSPTLKGWIPLLGCFPFVVLLRSQHRQSEWHDQ